MTTDLNKKKFELPTKKVRVQPIVRTGGWLTQVMSKEAASNFDGRFLYTGSSITISVPLTDRGFKPILTREEIDYFESPEAGMGLNKGDLSFYQSNRSDSYWRDDNFSIRLDKNAITLDLANPKDYILYKLLLANEELIAPSWDERNSKQTYLYALVEEGFIEKERASKADLKKEAYKEYGRLTGKGIQEMIDFLKVHFSINSIRNIKIPRDPSPDFLESEIDKIIEENAKKFLDTVNDKYFNTRLLIIKGIEKKAIEKDNDGYYLAGGGFLGKTMRLVIEHLEDDENQTDRQQILIQIDEDTTKE